MTTRDETAAACEPLALAARLAVGSQLARRSFLLLGAAFLASCAAPSQTASLPDAEFPGGQYDDLPAPRSAPHGATPRPASRAAATANQGESLLPGGVIPRARWARTGPDMKEINPMLPVTGITIHHEGWDPFVTDDFAETAARIEHVRVAHRNAKGGGYADIGYHFIIDRQGRIWEGRSLKYQGAHVKNHNEGNVGIMCLGNFEEQTPTPRQLAGLSKQVKAMMARYRVTNGRVYTHQEWRGAQTLCPGRTLQAWVNRARPGSFA